MRFPAATSRAVRSDAAFRIFVQIKRSGLFNEKTIALLQSFFTAAASSRLLNQTSVFEVDKGFNQSAIANINELDEIISDEMLRKPKAFSSTAYGGKTEKARLQRLYAQLGQKKTLSRSEAQYIVSKRMGVFRDDKAVGSFLKRRTGL